MRHYVTLKEHKIESGSTAVDTYGQVSTSTTAWRSMTNARAKIEQLSGTEVEIARQLYPKASHMVTVDYNATLASTGGARRAVLFGSRWLFIGAVINPDLENRQLQLVCGEER